MKLLLISMFAVAAFAAPQGYTLSEPSEPGLLVNREHSADGIATVSGTSTHQEFSTTKENVPQIGFTPEVSSNAETSLGGNVAIRENTIAESAASATGLSTATGIAAIDFVSECPEGQVRHVDGSCVAPEITRKIFLFSVPKQEQQRSDSLPELPPPKVDHNILFVRLPEGGVGPEPIVVPPPRQENIIYVLSKQSEYGQRVIEVPAPPPSEPEIYFVNYEEGENPALPGGLDLRTALGSAATASGQVIGEIGFLGDRAVEGDPILGVTDAGVHFSGSATSGVVEPQAKLGVSIVETFGSGGVAESGLENIPSVSSSGLYQTP